MLLLAILIVFSSRFYWKIISVVVGFSPGWLFSRSHLSGIIELFFGLVFLFAASSWANDCRCSLFSSMAGALPFDYA